MRNRLIVLEHEPVCHWCHKAKSTEADHLIETDRGGTDDLDNLVGSCKPCNAARGNRYLNNKRAQQQHSRAEHLGLQKNAEKTQKPKNNQNFFNNEKK